MSYNSHYGGPAGLPAGSNNGNRDRDRPDNRERDGRGRDGRDLRDRDSRDRNNYYGPYGGQKRYGPNYQEAPNGSSLYRRGDQRENYGFRNGYRNGYNASGPGPNGGPRRHPSNDKYELYHSPKYWPSLKNKPGNEKPGSSSWNSNELSGDRRGSHDSESSHYFVDERRQNNRKQEWDSNMYQEKRPQKSQLPHQVDHYTPSQKNTEPKEGSSQSQHTKSHDSGRTTEPGRNGQPERHQSKEASSLSSHTQSASSRRPSAHEDLLASKSKPKPKPETNTTDHELNRNGSEADDKKPLNEALSNSQSKISFSEHKKRASLSERKADEVQKPETNEHPTSAKKEIAESEPIAAESNTSQSPTSAPADPPNEKPLHMFDDEVPDTKKESPPAEIKSSVTDERKALMSASSELSALTSAAGDPSVIVDLKLSEKVVAGDDGDVSETETVVTDSPISNEKSLKFLRTKEKDDARRRLKRRIIHSSDDEDLDEEPVLSKRVVARSKDSESDDDLSPKPVKSHAASRKKSSRSPFEDDEDEEEAKEEEEEDGDDDDDDDDDSEAEDTEASTSSTHHSKKATRTSKVRTYKIKRDSTGRSLLQRACKKGDLDEVKSYIARGADANESDFGGFTCLHEAALAGHTDIVEFLIKHGADVNKQAIEAGDSETPLMDAAENKHLETVKVLLANGADPHLCNVDGFSALTKIYHLQDEDDEDYQQIIQLLDAASEVDGKSSLQAVSMSPRKVVEDPTDSYFADLLKKKGSMATIYKYIAQGHKEAAAEDFILHGYNLLQKPDILNFAARYGHAELVDILLGLNGDTEINQKNKAGVTVLLASVGRGNYDVVKFLLSKGADPNIKRDSDGLNALQVAKHSVHHDPREVFLLEQSMNGTLRKPTREAASVKVEKTLQENKSKMNEDDMDVDFEEKPRKRKLSEASELKKKKKLTKIKEPLVKAKEPQATKQEDETVDSVPAKEPAGEVQDSHDDNEDNAADHDIATRHKDSASASPAPAPLTKAQEEQKLKAAEEAKIWQMKVEAKKQARKEMFLQAEKEKERKRKEDEEKRVEMLKQQKIEAEERKIQEAQEAERLVQELKVKRRALEIELVYQHYPIGIREASFDGKITEQARLRFAPLYVFEIEDEQWVVDMQVALVLACPVSQIQTHCSQTKELDIRTKSKLWPLFYPMIGISALNEIDEDGKKKFEGLKLSYLRLSDVTSFVEEAHQDAFQLFWKQRRQSKVSLDDSEPVDLSNNEHQITDADKRLETSRPKFIPPRWRHRQDVLRTILSANTPLW